MYNQDIIPFEFNIFCPDKENKAWHTMQTITREVARDKIHEG